MSDFKENAKEIINKEGGTGCLNFMRDGEREQNSCASTFSTSFQIRKILLTKAQSVGTILQVNSKPD